MKKTISFLMFFLACTVAIFAQGADTVAYQGATLAQDIAQSAKNIVYHFPNVQILLTTWLPIALFVLAAVQFTLKRIPTQSSVKMTGILGWISDLLTAFQKDITVSCVWFICGILLIGSLSGCYVTKDCKFSDPLLNGTTQEVCLKCDSLIQNTENYVGAKIKVQLPKLLKK